MTIHTHKAVATDDALLAKLERACFPSDPWSTASIASHIASPAGDARVAYADGEPIGYLFTTVIPPEGEVLRIAILPEFRSCGAGTHLLTEFLSDTPITDCYLEVRASNLPAICLYKKHGFAEVGRRKKYYREPTEDAIVMKWERGENLANHSL